MAMLSPREIGAVVERLDNLRDDFKEHRVETKKELGELKSEIHDLKSERDKGKGWLTGASAAIALILSVLSFLLHGCASLDPQIDCNPPGRWGAVPEVAINPDMPADARDAVDQAVALLKGQRARFTVVPKPSNWLGFHGIVPPGFVAVSYAPVARVMGSDGSTYKERWGDISGPIKSADVEFSRADHMVVAHELGHALGFGSCDEPLGHSRRTYNLMFPIGPLGTELTPEQLEWIR